MIFDKEFVSYLTNYITSNDFTAKKYLNAYYMKFLDILNIEDENKQLVPQGYRLWDFPDLTILNFIYEQPIDIKPSGFLSFYSNIGNTKNMIKFLEFNNPTKLFYLIEERKQNLVRIYTPLEYINREEYTQEELEIIDETLETYRVESEYVLLKNEGYRLTFKNVKTLLMHERLADLIDFKEIHKHNNGYCSIPLTEENINQMKMSEVFSYLIEKKLKVNNYGCVLLDKFYDDDFMDKYNQEEIEEIIEEPIDIKKPIQVVFKPSN